MCCPQNWHYLCFKEYGHSHRQVSGVSPDALYNDKFSPHRMHYEKMMIASSAAASVLFAIANQCTRAQRWMP
ncbi:hypothetical protein CWS02_02775 [Enterobacter sp. EA-1]|nr:hypothetical protein CWS02_02775 [Enterobacter sp. EA-1]